MKTNKNINIFIAIIVLLVGTMLIANAQGQQMSHRKKPKKLDEAIPSPVKELFDWPTQSMLRDLKQIDGGAAEVIFPNRECLIWLKKVLSPLWLPKGDVEFIYIQGEFDSRDTVRASWQRNGFDIQVSQTRTIITIKLSPIDKKSLGVDKLKKINNAKQLCFQIFNKIGRRKSYDDNGWHVFVPVRNLPKKIVSFSFDPELVLYLDNDASVKGRAKHVREAKVKRPANKTEQKVQTDPNNIDWGDTSYAYDYWFRNINWWNDGKSVGFYFLKMESGSWTPSYDANVDKNFFRVSKSYKDPKKNK